jgi:transposase
MSVQQLTWLFFRKPDEVKAVELKNLHLIRQASPSIETAYHLVDQFLQMVRERTGEHLDQWLEAVKASQLQAFESCVTGVQQDKDAVLAGLTLPWSTGPASGPCESAQAHSKKQVWSRRSRSAQAARPLAPQKESG